MVTSLGYGLSALTHLWLHAVENQQHLHDHAGAHTETHSIEDHSSTLKVINQEQQEDANEEVVGSLFTFVFWNSKDQKNLLVQATTRKEKKPYFETSYQTRNTQPSTPPPIS